MSRRGLVHAWLAAGALAAALTACALEPEVGPLLAGACDNADTNPGRTVSFARDIRPIIAAVPPASGCNCHLAQTGSGPGPATVITGLDLGSYQSLVLGGHNSGANIVVPSQPCASILFQKVGAAPPFGSRMPLALPPLSAAQVQLIHDWIAEGAQDN
ncbi:MAG TPA: hypothetical protein VFP84_21270 [Kofleriaceae bacterium]|nr:hypothetical protein [Kofleriaceae bacterium]